MDLGSMFGNLLGGGGGEAKLAGAALDMIQKVPGGLSGLVNMFAQSGLAEQAQSWVSTGANKAISADQLTSALGADRLGSLAGQLGLSAADAASQLSGLLPNLVDRLTPNGQLPTGDLMEHAKGLLGGLLGGR